MTFKFCPECGMELEEKQVGDEGLAPFCPICQRPWFNLSHPCVLCVVICESGEIALIRQSHVSESYICVAGHVNQGETLEAAAKREVEEELGLAVLSAKYIGSYYYEKRDNLMLGFLCRVKKSGFAISSEVDSAKWFTVAEAQSALRPGSVAKTLLDGCIEHLTASKEGESK